MKKTKKKVLVLNKIQFAPIFDLDGNLFQTNNRLGPSLEKTFKSKLDRGYRSWITGVPLKVVWETILQASSLIQETEKEKGRFSLTSWRPCQR
ncbi:hypothetical protein Q8G35_04430 [Peribacillus simplex]|uniref:Uncharacterized protein n=2 Tax=Peribacillus TaxID=2675229 RepID=A0AA90NZT7_9BACI|nr:MULTISPECIES: hypothetical protein [Peribacillus]MDP1417652.1 hypothetical protein [Peribacillus simplex]MDP1450307.1 hypothetical protein [Peribacillus frigoritolerans]